MKIFLFTISIILLNVVSGEVAHWEGNFVPPPDGSINLKIILTLGTARNNTIQNATPDVGTVSLISREKELDRTENANTIQYISPDVGTVSLISREKQLNSTENANTIQSTTPAEVEPVTIISLEKNLDTTKNAELANSPDILGDIVGLMKTGLGELNTKLTNVGETIYKNLSLLVDESVKAIESSHFDVAEKKLSDIDNATYIFPIVKQVYKNEKNNFDVLMKFGEVIQNVDQRFILYKALYNELAENGDKDPMKLLRLSRSLLEKVLLATDTSASVDTNKTREEVESMISTIAKDFINLQRGKVINQKSAVELAFGIKELLNYECLKSDLKKKMKKIKNKLPKSVKNMVFLSQVCISDVMYFGYLYADQSSRSYVGDRKIFIGNRKDGPCKKEWTFEQIHGDVVRIYNRGLNETMYMTDEQFGEPNFRQYSKRLRKNDPSRVISEDEKWVIEPVTKLDVRLKNVAKNSYSFNGYSINGVWKMVNLYEIA